MVIGTAGSIGNTYLNFMFGSGSETVSDSIRHSIKNRTLYNRGYLSAIYNGTKDGFIRSHAENIRNGGFFSNFYKNIIGTAKEFKIDKSSLKKTCMNFGRGINRAVPIAFAVMSAVDGIPNIYRAFRDKGLKAGLKETTKTVARMTTAALFSTFATSFLRIPLLSGSWGYLVGDQIGGEIGDKLAGFCFGKTYTQKLRAEKKRMHEGPQLQISSPEQMNTNAIPQANLSTGVPPNGAGIIYNKYV